MAVYQYTTHLHQNSATTSAFDDLEVPGTSATWPGIYRCENCGTEIAIAQGHTLPPQGHSVHTGTLPIKWRLIVFAQHVVS